MAEGVLYGDYVLLGRLAEGGMAEIFLAKYADPGRGDAFLALKRTLPHLKDDADFATMFADEARIARALDHPHICKIFDTGARDGMQYIVMEFIHGKDLRVVARRAQQAQGHLPYPVIAYTLACIADALHHAHSLTDAAGQPAQIVHRDVSPTNVLIGYDGFARLIDFGIAKARDRLAKTRIGTVKGKFTYMSPEQAMGQPLDGRADIFALGIVLYEMLTGALPFRGVDEVSTLQQVTQGRYAQPLRAGAPIPRFLADVVARALAHERSDRYAHGLEMADALRLFLRQAGGFDAAALSAYMHEIFSGDYAAEAQRIAAYRAAQAGARNTAHDAATRNVEQLRQELLQRAGAPPASDPSGSAQHLADTVEIAQLLHPAPTREVTGLIQLLGRERVDAERTTVEVPVVEPPPPPVTNDAPTVEVARQPTGQEPTIISQPPQRPEPVVSDTLEVPVLDDEKVIDDSDEAFAFDESTRPLEAPVEMQLSRPVGATRPIARSDVDSARMRRAAAVVAAPATPAPTRRRRVSGGLSSAQLLALALALVLGTGAVGTTFYVTTTGLPAFAEAARPLLESVLGPLPSRK